MMDESQRRELATLLNARFELGEHEARTGGHGNWFVYLRREAIIARLDDVCPMDWHTKIVLTTRIDDRVEVVMEMTVAGVTRSFNGVAEDNRRKAKGDKPEVLFPTMTAKAATTDAFKRVASMFGIGLYLQSLGTIEASSAGTAFNKFEAWYNGSNRPVEQSHPPPKEKKPALPKQRKNPNGEQVQEWSADTKMDFTTALSKRFPGVLNPQIFKGMGIKSFEGLGTVSEAAAKVIAWMYDNEKPFVADVVQYVMGDGSPFLVFRADDNPGSGHVAVRAYGRSSTVKNEWLGEYAYGVLGFDTINKTPNKWLPLKYSLTVHYGQKTKDDGSVYYVATALGHSIYDPATVEAEGELEY